MMQKALGRAQNLFEINTLNFFVKIIANLYDGKTLVGYLTCLKEESISLLFLEPHRFIVNENLVILLEFFYIQKRC